MGHFYHLSRYVVADFPVSTTQSECALNRFAKHSSKLQFVQPIKTYHLSEMKLTSISLGGELGVGNCSREPQLIGQSSKKLQVSQC